MHLEYILELEKCPLVTVVLGKDHSNIFKISLINSMS